MEKIIVYENGLRLVVENIPSVRSVSTGIWVAAGSACETAENNGISHFTEHVMFKGTDKLSAFGLADAFERMGANVNAFTSKECTCYYVKSIDGYAEKCFGLLSHIFFDSTFPAAELDKERNVIAEEINMSEDSPEDVCYDLLAQSVYGAHPLGRTVLGPAENVGRFGAADVRRYTDGHYSARDTVVSLAGNITLAEADAFVKKYFLGKTRAKTEAKAALPEKQIVSAHVERIKDFEQSNAALAFPSVKFNDKLSTVQGVLNMIFGGAMSSRLFQRVREELGLAYSIYSAPSAYTNGGTFNVVVNYSAENTAEVLGAVYGEIKKLVASGVTDGETERAKTQMKSACVFAQENVQTIMTSNGKLLALSGEVYDIDKKIREIDAVTKSDLREFAERVFASDAPVCSAYVGKAHNYGFGKGR
jgi:predicted Zn-dependent peptidase